MTDRETQRNRDGEIEQWRQRQAESYRHIVRDEQRKSEIYDIEIQIQTQSERRQGSRDERARKIKI